MLYVLLSVESIEGGTAPLTRFVTQIETGVFGKNDYSCLPPP